MSWRLRPATEEDREFLYALHCATMRAPIERTWGWDESVQRFFFDQQFAPVASQVIVVDGVDVGVLQVESREDALFLANIQLGSAVQRRGLGAEIINALFADASRSRKALTLQVLKTNEAAHRLYLRLGFHDTSQSETHWLMRHEPTDASSELSSRL